MYKAAYGCDDVDSFVADADFAEDIELVAWFLMGEVLADVFFEDHYAEFGWEAFEFRAWAWGDGGASFVVEVEDVELLGMGEAVQGGPPIRRSRLAHGLSAWT
jgi:hypothetical protein